MLRLLVLGCFESALAALLLKIVGPWDVLA